NSAVAAATQPINVLVIGCSKRGGHGTAVKKKSTGKISARARWLPPRPPNATIVDVTVSKQIAQRTISGCHICSREYSSRKTSPPKLRAAKICVLAGICPARYDHGSRARFNFQYRPKPNPRASGGP